MFFRKFGLFGLLGVFSFLTLASSAHAADIIRLNPGHSESDKRIQYPRALLDHVMRLTEPEFGPFQFDTNTVHANRNQALKLLEEGAISVYEAPTQPMWEKAALPVRIPMLKGILGYKVFLIRDTDVATFRDISSLYELQVKPLGQGAEWSSTRVFEANHFTVERVQDYESLFNMLSEGRFDYFPRSLHEILPEYESRKDRLPNLAVEQHLALYMPLPVYFFVSPKQPSLHKRMVVGMAQMLADGSFDRLFFEHHQADLTALQLDQRRVFTMENPFLTTETPLWDDRLWYQPVAGLPRN